jgi:hypothetical protein
MGQRLLIILVALDVFIFALITMGNCKRNETISSAAYSLEQSGKWQGRLFRPLIDWLMSFQEADHCRLQYEFENPKEK